MKNLLGINLDGKGYDGEGEFAVRRIDGELDRKHESLTDEIGKLQKHSTLPAWLMIIMYVLLAYGAICTMVFVTAPIGEDAVSYATAYANAPWVIWTGVPTLLAGAALFLVQYMKGKRVKASSEYRYAVEKAEKITAESREALYIPHDAADCDVFISPYKVKKNGKHRSAIWGANYNNGSFWAFREGDALCIADTTIVFKIPFDRIERIVRVNKRISFQGWNKDVNYRTPQYKPYKIRQNNNGAFFVKPYLSIRIRGSEEWELILPPYETETIERITGKFAE